MATASSRDNDCAATVEGVAAVASVKLPITSQGVSAASVVPEAGTSRMLCSSRTAGSACSRDNQSPRFTHTHERCKGLIHMR